MEILLQVISLCNLVGLLPLLLSPLAKWVVIINFYYHNYTLTKIRELFCKNFMLNRRLGVYNTLAKISPSWINAHPLFCFEVLAQGYFNSIIRPQAYAIAKCHVFTINFSEESTFRCIIIASFRIYSLLDQDQTYKFICVDLFWCIGRA